MATHSPFTTSPLSVINSEQSSLLFTNAVHSGTLSVEASFNSPTTLTPGVPVGHSPQSIPMSPATPIQLFPSYDTTPPVLLSYAQDSTRINAGVSSTPENALINGQLFSAFDTGASKDAVQDTPICVSPCVDTIDVETKSDLVETEYSFPSPTISSPLPPPPSPLRTDTVSGSTSGIVIPCTARKQTFGNDGASDGETSCSGAVQYSATPSVVAAVHRFTPRAFLRHTSGQPPPSYAEAVGRDGGPSPRRWVGRLGDRPPTYSRVTRSQPQRATIVTPHRSSIKPTEWSPHPTRVSCRGCRRIVLSRVVAEDMEFTHLCALALCVLGCWPCCLLPYCMASCRRVWHVCPRCGHYMGVYSPRTPTLRSNTSTPQTASEANV